jgi:hypothetical protein
MDQKSHSLVVDSVKYELQESRPGFGTFHQPNDIRLCNHRLWPSWESGTTRFEA